MNKPFRCSNDLHAPSDPPEVLGMIEASRNHDSAALDWLRRASQAAENAARFNPSDNNNWLGLSLVNYSTAAMLLRAGRVTEAAKVLQTGATKPVSELNNVGRWSSLALMQAHLGNRSLVRMGQLGKAEGQAQLSASLNQLKRRALVDAARPALRLERFEEAGSF